MTSPTSVLSLSPENDEELVKAPAILFFQARVNHFLTAASTKELIALDLRVNFVLARVAANYRMVIQEFTSCPPDWRRSSGQSAVRNELS